MRVINSLIATAPSFLPKYQSSSSKGPLNRSSLMP